MHLAELKQKSISDLNDVARELKIDAAANLSSRGSGARRRGRGPRCRRVEVEQGDGKGVR